MNDDARHALEDGLARLAGIRAALSEARLGRYLAAFDNDLETAIECHHWNSRIGHALFLPIQLFEITLRNKLDAKLQEAFGEEWLIDWPDWLYDKENRTNRQRKKIEETIERITLTQGKVATHSKIVAELSFSFWVHLLSRPYIETLWVPHLRHCFAGSSGGQKEVYERAGRLVVLRNRISHHEPILFEEGDIRLRSPEGVAALSKEVIEAVGWMCGYTHAFAEERCSFGELHRGFEAFFESVEDTYSRGIRQSNWRPSERLRIIIGSIKFFDRRKSFGYIEAKNHPDIRIDAEVMAYSGIDGLQAGQPVEATFEYVGRSAIARSLRPR